MRTLSTLYYHPPMLPIVRLPIKSKMLFRSNSSMTPYAESPYAEVLLGFGSCCCGSFGVLQSVVLYGDESFPVYNGEYFGILRPIITSVC